MKAGGLAYNRDAQRVIHDLGVFGMVACTIIAVSDPGSLIGAGCFWWFTQALRPARVIRWAVGAGCAVLFLAAHVVVEPGWLWRSWPNTENVLHYIGIGPVYPSLHLLLGITIETLLGPVLVLACAAAASALRVGVMPALRAEQRRTELRMLATTGLRTTARTTASETDSDSTPRIALGIDRETREIFSFERHELMHHIFLPGASGSGKTTTIARIADGVCAARFGVVIVDCKGGGGLKHIAESLAAVHDLSLHVVDANDPGSIGYDVCTGSAADITNKLTGIFNYGTSGGEFYKHVAMMVIPTVVRAMEQAGDGPITLATLTEGLIPGRMRQIGQRAGEPYHRELTVLAEERGAVGDGIAGLRVRLMALLNGKFRDLLLAPDTAREVLSWPRVLTSPSVVYVNLPATAASEDVELLGRVVAQDLKQECARRIGAIRSGQQLTPTLVVFDEFAALPEADQIVDLLLQAREGLLPTLVSTQYIPETTNIRQAVLQAGLIVAHRIEAADAEVIAAQFGTRMRWEASIQIEQSMGPTGMASAREQNSYHVNPNELRELRTGYVAVRSVFRSRPAIVQVEPVGATHGPEPSTLDRLRWWWMRGHSGIHRK